MFQYLDSFNINILMVANEIRPYKSQTDHRRQMRDAVNVAQMGVLDVKPSCLHGAKAGLYLPTLLIGSDGQFRPVVADKDLKFWYTLGVFQQCSGNVDILTLEQKQLVVDTLLTEF